MRKFAAAGIAGLFAVALAAPVFGKSESITGQLIDLSCYAQDKANTGNEHKGRGLICAQACAREGFAVGILTADGKVYQLAGGLTADSNAKLVPHMAETVTVTGDVTEKDGRMTLTANDLKTN